MRVLIPGSSAVVLTLALSLLSGPAHAQEIPCDGGPCTRPQRRGTHFLAEVNGGGALMGKGGLAIGGLVGVGGKLRGFPLRFYLVGEFAYSSASDSVHLPGTALGVDEERSYRDVGMGLRIYIPVYGPLRLFLDAMGGASYAAGTFHRQGLATLSAGDWKPLALTAAGVQFRLFHHLSLGARAKIVFTSDGMEELRTISGGSESSVRSTITAGLTWHF